MVLPAAGQPFGKESTVLQPAFIGAVIAELVVTALTGAVGKCDERFAASLVFPLFGDVIGATGHLTRSLLCAGCPHIFGVLGH